MTRPLEQVPGPLAARYRRAGWWNGERFDAVLRARARERPDHLAVIDARHRWTYAELDRRVDALAAGFLAMGFAPGDRVLVQLPNRVEFLSVTFALLRAGVVPVFCLPAHRLAEVEHFARTASVRAYIIADHADGFDYRELARQLTAAVPAVTHVFVAGEPAEFIALDAVAPGAIVPGAVDAVPRGFSAPHDFPDAPREFPVVPADRLALVQLSGGSGGRSKLIPRATDDYLYSVRASVPIAGVSRDSVFMPMVPVAHNFPMSSPGFLGVVYAGGTTVLVESRDPEEAFRWIERERVTHVCMVPPLALLWLDAVAHTTADLSSLEVFQVGGQKLKADAARRIMPAFGCRLQQVFGMAEGLVNYTRLDDPDDVICETQGRPISPDDELRLVDADDVPVPPGTPGRLLTRGPYTIRGYLDDPAANADAFTADGFYRTGDVVTLRPDGYLVVEGRVTDQINRGGEKISADEIEAHLLAYPHVHDAVVVGLGDAWLGERSCAFLIVRGETPRVSAVKTWLRERGLAAYKIPDRIRFVDAFPETGVGKVARRELRERLRASVPDGTGAGQRGGMA